MVMDVGEIAVGFENCCLLSCMVERMLDVLIVFVSFHVSVRVKYFESVVSLGSFWFVSRLSNFGFQRFGIETFRLTELFTFF